MDSMDKEQHHDLQGVESTV